MQYAAYRSGNRACALVAACIALTLAGCSSNVSRFDFPVFGSTASNDTNADYAATASLPPVVPEESVYSGGANPQFQRASLPPPSYSPAPTQAAYSPPPGRVRDQHAKYPAPPHTEPAVWRGTSQVQGLRIKVQKGETLSSLSRRYGVSVEAIQAANNLPDGRLNIGQEMVIPGASAKTAAAKPVAPKVTPEPEPAVPSLPSVAEEETSPAPGGTAVRVVKTTTILPPGSTSLAEEEEKEAGVAPAAKSAKPASTEEKAAASPEITGEGKQRLAKVEQLPAPDPMSGNSFRWPVKGRVISQFGARPDGGHNDGIDLAVPQGTPVQAAENGVVAYAGNELKGYGNLVLIRHSNNWVSAYAHNEEILVKRGDKVSRGQVIAKAGATGAVSQPLVHFELRKGSRPVDPTKYMSNQTAKAD